MARLEAYAEGRKLSACVRELLDHALSCPSLRPAQQEQDTPRKRQAAPAD